MSTTKEGNCFVMYFGERFVIQVTVGSDAFEMSNGRHHCGQCGYWRSCQPAQESRHSRTLSLAAKYDAVVPARVDTTRCVRFTAGNRLLTICCDMCTTANVKVNTPSPVPYDLVIQSKYELNPGRRSSKCSFKILSLDLFMFGTGAENKSRGTCPLTTKMVVINKMKYRSLFRMNNYSYIVRCFMVITRFLLTPRFYCTNA